MADITKIKTEYGNVVIPKETIAQIANDVIEETSGVNQAKPWNSVNVDFKENGADISCEVVVDFGTSISDVTYAIISEIRSRVRTVLERNPSEILIKVTGIKTTKSVIKRNIEVRRNYGAG